MRIRELHLNNWAVIREVNLQSLSDLVVVAGPNGVGKTKIKEALVHVFQNNGNPPPGSKVVLEATTATEKTAWGADTVLLPQPFWNSFFGRNHKRLKTESRLIQINANRAVDGITFGQLTFSSIGDPESEEIGHSYGYNDVKNRFEDICRTLHRIKSKEVTSVYKEYRAKRGAAGTDVTVPALPDPLEKYMTAFNQLLYPKQMVPLEVESTTIQYKDVDGTVRTFSELSSGEREVVILAFDILAQDPDDCVVLIDEPELHLHPELTFRLIKTLKGIGNRNQFFLFTHSTDIIGNALEEGVHFIRPKSAISTGNQAVRVDQSNVEELRAIPNIRETIGMVSVGKKLLFVEGSSSSIDRNVFATLAKAARVDVAIIPSDSCSNINNMALVCDTLQKGIFGIELHMVRDRDGLIDSLISTFTAKSKGRLQFLPFYHIENAFLHPEAIEEIARKVLLSKAPTAQEIGAELVRYATAQINSTAALYVKSEIYFRAGSFDVSPAISINASTPDVDIVKAITSKRDVLLARLTTDFSDAYVNDRFVHWKSLLTASIANGWSASARQHFFGKRLLAEIQASVFGPRIKLWEHIVQDKAPACRAACAELSGVLAQI